jgi:uncharacterized membrane protein
MIGVPIVSHDVPDMNRTSKGQDHTMVHAQSARYADLAWLQPLGILLLSPLIIILSAAILLGLLGIFVAWLLVVAALVTAIVVSDLARRSMQRLAPPDGALRQRAVGYPGR